MQDFGHLMGNIVNFILLLPVYFLGVGITSIIAKLLGKHFLSTKKGNSTWTKHLVKTQKIDEYYRMF